MKETKANRLKYPYLYQNGVFSLLFFLFNNKWNLAFPKKKTIKKYKNTEKNKKYKNMLL